MNLRADAVEVLRAYRPADEDQERLRTEYLEYVLAHEDAVQRTGVPDHVTASVLVVADRAERVLLALHGKAGRWFQTGGHIEPEDESLAAAALREGIEESGLGDLSLVGGPLRLDAHPAPCATPGARRHLDVQYVAVSRATSAPVVSAESLDVRWFGADALPASTDASVRALVAAARDRLG